MLLVNSGGEKAAAEWQACFAKVKPELPVAYLDDPTVKDDAVNYVLVYNPRPGRLAQFKNLRLIISTGAGVDHVTNDPDWPRHIPLVRMGGRQTSQRMSEYVCLSALCLLREMRRIAIAQSNRRWDHFETDRSAPDTKVGVMGLGNLGLPAARMLSALGFQVIGWSRNPKAVNGLECYFGDDELTSFLSQVDILVCLLPGTASTRDIISSRTISLLPKGASIVNAARGNCVNTQDLLDALDKEHLSGAVLDVFEPEPLASESDLWRHPKILITPHIAALSTRADRAHYAAEVISLFESGLALPNLYNVERGY